MQLLLITTDIVAIGLAVILLPIISFSNRWWKSIISTRVTCKARGPLAVDLATATLERTGSVLYCLLLLFLLCNMFAFLCNSDCRVTLAKVSGRGESGTGSGDGS